MIPKPPPKPVKHLLTEFPDTTFIRKNVERVGIMQLAPGQGPDGYGRQISTDYMAIVGNKKLRVYCCCFSNAGTCYVLIKGEWHTVRDGDVPDNVRNNR
jgi:hypothetical protein